MSEVIRLGESEDKRIPQNIITCYVDPNTDLNLYGTDNDAKGFVPGGGNSGQLIIPPEDLSIYVSLIALPHISSRWGGEGKNIEISTIINKQSIPSGSDMGYSNAKIRYLTTDYLDYGWDMWHPDNMKKYEHGQPEALGIRRINISYTSWKVPNISITFVDIMGLATFSPMQVAFEHTEKGNVSPVQSLFKSFYSLPYSRYNLTIKGYYGNPVTHSLQVSRVSSNVNTTSGNIEITVDFVGYKWKRYTDVLASWVFISPYLKEPTDMSKRWVERGYKTREGKNMLKYLDLRTAINEAVESIEKLPDSSDMGRIQQLFQDIMIAHRNVNEKIREVRNNVGSDLFEALVNDNTTFPYDDINTLILEPSGETGTAQGLHSNMAVEPNIIWKIEGGWVLADQKYVDVCNYCRNILKPAIDEYDKEIERLTTVGGYSDKGLVKLPFANGILFYYFYSKRGETPKRTEIVFDIRDLTKRLEENIKVINSISLEYEVLLRNDLNKQAEKIIEKLPFVPSMYNVIKWIFAHYIHFLEGFVEVGKESPLRIVGVDTEQKLQPWFMMQKDIDDGNGYVKKYPYLEQYKKLPEILYTTSVYKELTDMVGKLEELRNKQKNEDGENDEIVPSPYRWNPIFPYDVSYKVLDTATDRINPYKKILENYRSPQEAIGNIAVLLITRMFASIGTRETINNIDAFAEAEADNIFDAIKSEERLRNVLRSKLQDNEFRNLLFKIMRPNGGWSDENIESSTYNLVKNSIGVDTMTIAWSNDLHFATWSFVITLSNILSVLPLTSKTFVGMKQVVSTKNIPGDDSAYLLACSDHISLERQYSNLSKNIVKGSYRIVDLTEDTSNNISVLYDRILKSDNKGIVNNIWINIENGYKNEERNCFIDLEYTISGNNDYFANYTIGNETNIIDTNNFKENIISKHPDVDEKELFDTIPNFISKLRSGNDTICLAIPRFSNQVLSIFAMPEYYNYNNLVDNENIDMRNRYKAVLLLRTLGMSPYYLDKYISEHLKNWGIRRIPKYFALYIGGISWLYDTNTRIRSDLPFMGFFTNPENQNTIFPNLRNLSYDVKKSFISYFEEWVEESGKHIIRSLEYGRHAQPNQNNTPLIFLREEPVQSEQTNTFPLFSENIQNMFSGDLDTNFSYKPSQPAYKSAIGIYIVGRSGGFSNGSGNRRNHSIIDAQTATQYILDPSSNTARELMSLYKNDVLIYNSRSGVLKSGENSRRKTQISIQRNNIETYVKALNEELLSLLEDGQVSPTFDSEQTNTGREDNEIIKMLYIQFKRLHDMWFVGISNKEQLEDETDRRLDKLMSKVMIVDQYFCDISDKLYVNLESLNDIIENTFTSIDYSVNLLEVLSKITSENNCLMLPSPSLGFFSGNSEEAKKYYDQKHFLNYLFKPQMYNETNHKIDEDYGLIIMLTGDPADTPTTDSGEVNDFENTALQLTYQEDMDKLNHNRKLVGNTVSDQPLRAFGVTFGRQNESFFQIQNLNTDEPKITEQSVRALTTLLTTAKEDTMNSVYIGENLYSSFSKMAYMVNISLIGGSAPLFPLMYFQLNNTYLFTGGYIIIEVSHTIENNLMRTNFRGVKQSFARKDILRTPIIQMIGNNMTPRVRLTDPVSGPRSSKNWKATPSQGNPPDKIEGTKDGNKIISYNIKNVILSPGHFETCSGKRSPKCASVLELFNRLNPTYRDMYNSYFSGGDSKIRETQEFREFAYNRLIQDLILNDSRIKGKYNVTHQSRGSSQGGRISYVNQKTATETLHVVIHNNALDGGWRNANGWQIYTRIGQPSQSLLYADIFLTHANNELIGTGRRIHTNYPMQGDWRGNDLVELRSKVPAVLTENFFMSNKEDISFLLSDRGIQTIVNIHVKAIIDIMNRRG